MPPEIALLVPFDARLEVAKLGARWDENERAWMWESNKPKYNVKKWLPRIYRDDLKPPHLTPALVPECMWGVNLRSLLPDEQWDRLEKIVIKKPLTVAKFAE